MALSREWRSNANSTANARSTDAKSLNHRVSFDVPPKGNLHSKFSGHGASQKRSLSEASKPAFKRRRANSDSALPKMGPFASPNRPLGVKAAVRASTRSASQRTPSVPKATTMLVPSKDAVKMAAEAKAAQQHAMLSPTASLQPSPPVDPPAVSPMQMPNASLVAPQFPPPITQTAVPPPTPRPLKSPGSPVKHNSHTASTSTGGVNAQRPPTALLISLLLTVPVIILAAFLFARCIHRKRSPHQRRRNAPILYAAPRYEPELSLPPSYEVAVGVESKYAAQSKLPVIARADSDNC